MNTENRTASELRMLASLCVASPEDARARAVRLAAYPWTTADAAAMCSAIRGALAKNAPRDRATLAAIATREGFPDLDWDFVLAPGASAQKLDVDQIIAELEQ